MSLDGFEHENLGQILEWSPTVMVHDAIYELVDSMALKVDAVVTKDPHFNTQESTRLILSDTEPLEDALKFLVAEQYPAVNIITNQFVLKDYVLFVDDLDIVVFIGNKKIFFEENYVLRLLRLRVLSASTGEAHPCNRGG